MPTAAQVETQDGGFLGVSRSESVGRAQRNARGREAGIPPGVGDMPGDVRELSLMRWSTSCSPALAARMRSSGRAGCFRS